MKHTLTLYVADRRMNSMMQAMDLRPDFKWFVTPTKVSFSSTKDITPEYFDQIIEKSRSGEEFWIPAISYMGNWFQDPGVKILSDGKTEMFITQEP